MSTDTTHPAGHTPPTPNSPMVMPSDTTPGAHTHMSTTPHQATMAMPTDQGLIWPHFANMTIGLWLITSAFAAAYGSARLEASDIIVGVAVIAFSVLSLSHRPFWKLWAPWSNAVVGLWVLFAPLVFWAPTAAGYTNDTLAGALIVVFAVLAPGMPMAPGMKMEPGPDIPPGWSYNPSSWPQRAPIITLALIAFLLSRQMASFELGHTTSFPDPFFGNGTVRVLTSKVSKAFPIPDAGLGAVAYMIEFLMGFMGDKRRWRTMPWMVTFFGILVIPLGVASITLIILQPLAVGAWCTPCLIAAAAMLIMIALTLDEVIAMCQFLAQTKREGKPLWHTFWLGGTVNEQPADGAIHTDVVTARAMFRGTATPWNLLLSAGGGVWLMFAPAVLKQTGAAADSDHLIGALIVTTAVIALSDVGRIIRFFNIILGAWIIASPWLLDGGTHSARWSDVIAGALIVVLSARRGPVSERYGTWQHLIR